MSIKFKHSRNGAPGPFFPETGLKCQAGTTQAIANGQLLELSSGNFIPLTTDKSMTATVAVAHDPVKAGDLAGYYKHVVPRPGDVFEADLLSTDSQAPVAGTALYVSSDGVLTTTAGTNIIGYVVGHDGYPQLQGHKSDDASHDRGTTIGACPNGKVLFTFKEAVSYLKATQVA